MKITAILLIKTLITDLIDSDLFTLPLLAKALNIQEDILSDICLALNTDPSCSILFGLLYLHQLTFPGIYSRYQQPATGFPSQTTQPLSYRQTLS